MSKKQIELTIDETGNTTIDVEGYTDGSCRTATEAIEKALGGVTDRKTKTGGACDVKQTVKAGAK
jgi:hypothetical protein